MAYTKEQIISEIKAIADRLGTKSLKQCEWTEHSSISLGAVRNHFGNWNKAVMDAGLNTTNTSQVTKDAQTISNSDLLADLIRLQKQHGKVTESLVNSEGTFSTQPYRKRWKSIKVALAEAFHTLHAGELITDKKEIPVNQNYKEAIPNISNKDIIGLTHGLHVPSEKIQTRKRSIVGQPLDFRGMRFAPVNEQGVVYLFGMVSQELGFFIESVRVKYPDCEGKRCCDSKANLWEHLYIEFEYKSTNFVEHGHNPEDCDLIVCWIHDWKDCPLEVLELREAIRVLPKKGLIIA